MTTAALVSRLAAGALASVAANGPIMGMDGHTMARKMARENGGKPRHLRGHLRGWRFPDGSALTVEYVEIFARFPGEKG